MVKCHREYVYGVKENDHTKKEIDWGQNSISQASLLAYLIINFYHPKGHGRHNFVTKISLESWYKDRSQAVKWWKFPLNQSHSRVMGGRRQWQQQTASLLITAQNKPEQQGESGVYVEIPHSASLEESQCLTENPEIKKKRKSNKSQLKISHTPTAPSQMHGCLEARCFSRYQEKLWRNATEIHRS